MLKFSKLTFNYFAIKEQGMFKVVILLIFLLISNIFAMQDQEVVVDQSPKPVRIAFFIDDPLRTAFVSVLQVFQRLT